MRSLIGIACLTVLLVEMAALLGPSVGASTGKGARLAKLQDELRTRQPEVVFIGNSILLDSTDEKVFTDLSGRATWILGHRGSASAWWYLALKNVILAPRAQQISSEQQRPRLVVVFFRDCGLTDPGFRITGEFRPGIERMSGPEEPLLDALAYRGTMDRIDYLLFRYCPLYRHRQVVRQELSFRIKSEIVPSLTGIRGVDGAIDRTFADENMDAELLTVRQLAAASSLDEEACDFKARLSRSFLPHMIRLARDNGVQLTFVRMKRRRDTAPNREPPALQRYIQDLETYLAENHVPLVDFTDEPRITADLYGVGDHLNTMRGTRRRFTGLLAERLAPVLADLPR